MIIIGAATGFKCSHGQPNAFHLLATLLVASFEPSQQLRRPRAQASRFAVVVFGTSMTLACRTQIYSLHSPQEETMCPLFVFFFGK